MDREEREMFLIEEKKFMEEQCDGYATTCFLNGRSIESYLRQYANEKVNRILKKLEESKDMQYSESHVPIGIQHCIDIIKLTI